MLDSRCTAARSHQLAIDPNAEPSNGAGNDGQQSLRCCLSHVKTTRCSAPGLLLSSDTPPTNAVVVVVEYLALCDVGTHEEHCGGTQ